MTLILASQSQTRGDMLRAAGISFTARAARVDEAALKDALTDQGISVRNIADALAEAKAVKISLTADMIADTALVLGADQTLEMADGTMLSKPASPDEAAAHLRQLSGQRHTLHSAAVIAENGDAIWRAVETASLTMRHLSENFIEEYVAAHWEDIRYCVGCYQIEGIGAQLFNRVEGSHFAVLGLPLLPLLFYLRDREILAK